MRPLGSAKVLEARRRKALALVRDGLSFNAAAQRLGCAPSSVMRWIRAVQRGGTAALKVRPTPGRPPRLTGRQRARLLTLLRRGPLAHGYRTDVWTTQRIAEVIQAHFGVTYHRDHIGRLLAACDWSYQKPTRRALERDETAIARWKRTRWPQVKKTRHGWGPTLPS